MSDSFLKALNDANAEIQRLIKQRNEIDLKLSKLKQTVSALSALCERPLPELKVQPRATVDADLGISDAIRKVMFESKLPMTAPQIRDSLLNLGYDVDQYSSILTVIHNTIKRMEKQGEIAEVKTSGGVFVGWIYKPRPTDLAELAYEFKRKYAPLEPDGRKRRKAIDDAFMGR